MYRVGLRQIPIGPVTLVCPVQSSLGLAFNVPNPSTCHHHRQHFLQKHLGTLPPLPLSPAVFYLATPSLKVLLPSCPGLAPKQTVRARGTIRARSSTKSAILGPWEPAPSLAPIQLNPRETLPRCGSADSEDHCYPSPSNRQSQFPRNLACDQSIDATC